MTGERAESSIWTPEFLGVLLGACYDILRQLGEGAGGNVFLARDRELDRLIALKTILDPAAVTC